MRQNMKTKNLNKIKKNKPNLNKMMKMRRRKKILKMNIYQMKKLILTMMKKNRNKNRNNNKIKIQNLEEILQIILQIIIVQLKNLNQLLNMEILIRKILMEEMMFYYQNNLQQLYMLQDKMGKIHLNSKKIETKIEIIVYK